MLADPQAKISSCRGAPRHRLPPEPTIALRKGTRNQRPERREIERMKRLRLREGDVHALGLAAGGSERYHWVLVAAKRVPDNAPTKSSSGTDGALVAGNWTVLVDHAARILGATVAPTARAAVETWLGRLRDWNARIDLTAARTPEELIDLMLADALVLAGMLPRGVRVIDVGTGAGAPGLALALLRDDLQVTLVEPLAKRTSFLRTVIGAVGRGDISVERARGESLSSRREWDVAISRATLPPEAWLDLGTNLVAAGGDVWVLLAKDAPPSHHAARLEHEKPYTWPLTCVERRMARYRVDA
jgi:16S rRNA (guanine527-N7)-methyltransferase